MSDTIKTHLITIEIPSLNYVIHDNVLTWLIENVLDDDWQVEHIDDSYFINFKNTSDAVAFKLIWC